MKNKRNGFKIRCLAVFLLCTSFLNAQSADINSLRTINVHRNEHFDPAFRLLSKSALPLSMGTPILMYSVARIRKDSTLKKQAVFIGETFLVNAFITVALKQTVKRARPYETYPDIDQAIATSGYSFPSGHTSLAFATATAWSMAYPKWYVVAPSFAWATAVGYSRMHLGVHYPTDVLAGAIVGSGSAFITYKANKWLNKKRARKDR